MTDTVATSKSGFVRTVQAGSLFEIQALAIRGERKLGPSPYWRRVVTIYGANNKDQAINVMNKYCGEA